MAAPIEEGSLVRLVGLTSSALLNGAEGVVVSQPEGDPPRYPVRLLRPKSAAAAHPEGVRVKRANLEPVEKEGQGKAAEGGRKQKGAKPPAPPSAPGAGASGSGSRPGGGGGSGRAPLDLHTREEVSRMGVQGFLKALDDDLYPSEEMERIFGVSMHPQGGKKEWDLGTWPMGNLTFGAWITIRNWYIEDKMQEYGPPGDSFGKAYDAALQRAVKRARQDLEDELVGEMLAGRLPAWYRGQLLKLEEDGRASAYAVEIIRRGFKDIPWDTELLGRFGGLI